MNKNKQSFASRARKLINRYKRASYDKVEKEELDAALAALAQEQEAYKQANGIGEYSPENIQAQQMQQMEQQQVGQEGLPQFPWGGGLPGTLTLADMTQADVLGGRMPFIGESVGLAQQAGGATMPKLSSMITNPVAGAPETTIGRTQGILPSVLAGGVSAIGNLVMGANTKPYQYSKSYSAPQLSLAKERDRLTREAALARSIVGRNARTSGSRGQYLAGVGAAQAGIGQGLSDALSKSYTTEGLTNLQQKDREMEVNRQIDMMNFQARMQADQEKKAYAANALNAITGAGTDINQILGQNALMESLGSQNYMVSPSENKKLRDLLLGRTIKGKVRPTK